MTVGELRDKVIAVGYRKNKRPFFRRQDKYCWASELSNTRILGLESGTFWAIHRPEAPKFATIWRLVRVTAFLFIPIAFSGFALPTYTLKGQAALRGITYGGAVGYYPMQDRDFKAAVLNEMDMIVPENELKWDTLRPSPTIYDFTKADYLINFARVHGKKIRGHCLEVVNKSVENSLSGSLTFDIMQPVSLGQIAAPLARPLW